jgi:hypothetical protein
LLTLALVACLMPTDARANERYYITLFGSQRPVINNPNFTHSFALLVKTVGCDEREQVTETLLISWMPADLKIQAYRLRPEPGANLNLPTTFHWILGTGQRVSQWGPYQIQPDLYVAACQRVGELESGDV